MLIEEFASESLTPEQWETTHWIAQTLVDDGTDVNELNKIITYLHTFVEQEDAGKNFFQYLELLVNKTRRKDSPFARSNKTPEYYRSIHKACHQYLHDYQNNAPLMLEILSWTSRMMRYYKVVPKNHETRSVVSERTQKIQLLTKSKTFNSGDILEAKVIKKHSKGNRVTYEVFGIRFKEKEPKKFSIIPENETVKVEIKSLKDDGSINHVKFIQLN